LGNLRASLKGLDQAISTLIGSTAFGDLPSAAVLAIVLSVARLLGSRNSQDSGSAERSAHGIRPRAAAKAMASLWRLY
jgi:hypothetical protein